MKIDKLCQEDTILIEKVVLVWHNSSEKIQLKLC